MAWLAAAPWIASAAGGLLGGLLDRSGQKSANETNINLNKENRDFQERMSSTAHQREVADLLKAGLNPMLSGMGGSGASSPSGSVANVDNTNRGLAANVSSASRAMIEKRLGMSQVNLQQSQSSAADSAAQFANEQGRTFRALRPYVVNSAKAQADIDQIGVEAAKAALPGLKVQGELDSNKALRMVERALGVGSSATSLLNPFSGVITRRFGGK